MIVRDEAPRIESCLASVRPCVDEMIVVDTGSTDGTVEIGRRCGAQVHHFAWCDDFSAARNESIRHAQGEWIFWMDADDTIDEESGRKLQTLSRGEHQPGVLGYVMQVRFPGPESDGATDVTVVDHVKMFRNRPEIRFEGRIHEQILPSIRQAGGGVKWTDIRIDHSGHDFSPEGQAKKRERDLRLLELEVAERPYHPFVLFNLGMTHYHMGEDEKAIDALKQCVIVSTPTESHTRKAYALLSGAYRRIKQPEIAWSVCQTGRKLFPGDAELLFREGELLQQFGRFTDAEAAYRQLLDGERGEYFGSFDHGILGFRTRHHLAETYLGQGKWDKAEQELRQTVEEAPSFLPAWTGLLDLLMRQGRRDVAMETTEWMLGQPKIRTAGHIWRSHLAESDGQIDAARRELESAVKESPDDPRLVEELCRLLFEHGPLPDAEAMLKHLTELQPDSAAAHQNLGVVYLRQERYEDAIAALTKALDRTPAAPQTLLYLGDALEKSGRHDDALTAWNQALELTSDNDAQQPLHQAAHNRIHQATAAGE